MPELSGLLRHTAGLGNTQPKVGKHAQRKPTSSSMLEHRITLLSLLLASGSEDAAKNKTHTALLQQLPRGPAHTMTGPSRRGTACPWHSTKGPKQDGIHQAFLSLTLARGSPQPSDCCHCKPVQNAILRLAAILWPATQVCWEQCGWPDYGGRHLEGLRQVRRVIRGHSLPGSRTSRRPCRRWRARVV